MLRLCLRLPISGVIGVTDQNFLFISIDDLNDWTNGLDGYSGTVHTPNLDALMDDGTTFTNAYSQAAICNPSRTSVLTGQEPQNTGVFSNQYHYWEEQVDPEDTLFGVFNDAGYNSQGVGKLFHTGASREANAVMFDDYRYLGKDNFGVEIDGKPAGPYTGDEIPADAQRAEYVAEYLTNYDPQDGPLLMSVGLLKPHTDWVVPQEYFDLYPIDEIQIDYVPNDLDDIPDYVLEVIGQDYPWNADDVGSELVWKQLIQAYLATISFMDAQVGVMIDALDSSAIADDTAVVLWSDHGYHLGDKEIWHKFTLWDNAAKAPLIIRDPGNVPAGIEVSDPVELLDIFPTMLDMAGIPEDGLELDGKSLVPYFEGSTPEGEAVAFTWMYGNVSIRTAEYRYSLYQDGSEELYDVVADPELTVNLADDPGHSAQKAELKQDLYDKFSLVGYGDTAAVLFGSDSDDVISDVNGGAAAGKQGDDIYFVSSSANVVEQQGGGHDLIVTEATSYTLPAYVEDLEMKGFSDRVTGNDGSNTIIANAWKIYAEGGNDIVLAGNRSSFIDAGSGDDLIKGENGDDTIGGGDGNDTLEGGFGNDRLFGGLGNDKISSVDGSNIAYGGIGDDELIGGNGGDTLFGEAGADILNGGAGHDNLAGGSGFDTLNGGTGKDSIEGGDQADLLRGGQDDDLLVGSRGADQLYGDAGNDTLKSGDDADRLYGGVGDDVLFAGSSVSFTVDGLFGESGNDVLYGETGFDHLDGGEGDDLLDGGNQADNLYGRSGNDTLRGGQGLDRLFGGDGDDFGRGGIDNDGLFGGNGNDSLNGESGQDRVFGEAGNDLLDGNVGQDTLYGGSGFDTLIGGAGNDLIYGNFNADWFVFVNGHGNDTIADFEETNAFEVIDLRGVSEISNFYDLKLNHAAQIGEDIVIDTGDSNSITILNVQLSDLESSSFLF